MKIEKCRFTYSQESDTCGDGEDQILEVQVMDGGGGPYITIKTKRWSFDSTTEFINQMERIFDTLRNLEIHLADDKAAHRS